MMSTALRRELDVSRLEVTCRACPRVLRGRDSRCAAVEFLRSQQVLRENDAPARLFRSP
jgi:hypothetical protein